MESRVDVWCVGHFQGVYGTVQESVCDFVRAIIAGHEFCHMISTFLQVVTPMMHGGEHDQITDFHDLASTVSV